MTAASLAAFASLLVALPAGASDAPIAPEQAQRGRL
jgi:hypothetical protein